MRATFDLPDALLRRAKVRAAEQGRPLRDLVAEAIGEKLEYAMSGAAGIARSSTERREAWERWETRLEQLPDGSWFNPAGIDDDSFFQSLDEIRRHVPGLAVENWFSEE